MQSTHSGGACVFLCVCGHRGITRNLPFLLTRLCVSAWKVGQRMTTSIFHCRYFGDGAGTDATLGHRNTHTRRGTLQHPVKTQIKSANVQTWVDLFQLQLKSLSVYLYDLLKLQHHATLQNTKSDHVLLTFCHLVLYNILEMITM